MRVYFIEPDKDRLGSGLSPAPPFGISVKAQPDWQQPPGNNVTILRTSETKGNIRLMSF